MKAPKGSVLRRLLLAYELPWKGNKWKKENWREGRIIDFSSEPSSLLSPTNSRLDRPIRCSQLGGNIDPLVLVSNHRDFIAREDATRPIFHYLYCFVSSLLPISQWMWWEGCLKEIKERIFLTRGRMGGGLTIFRAILSRNEIREHEGESLLRQTLREATSPLFHLISSLLFVTSFILPPRIFLISWYRLRFRAIAAHFHSPRSNQRVPKRKLE